MEGNRLHKRVSELLEEALGARPELFLIDLKVNPDQSIQVTLDGDEGVSLQDCMDISRAIEHSLDRDAFDFSLEVGSAGATAPLVLPRQFHKHIGRKLAVRREGRELEGTLTAADEKDITLSWKAREPKPVGKGKHTVRKEEKIPHSEIEQAKVVLKF
ncbi:ribosome assembly cofactor RimP [Robiginitalea sp. SC105]|uniref:ribosome assembly cofactor RimP n=1 Tax=Robiginitalea sp. SC105 TaxID=2762332 RepID=UPI00163A4D0E|nr:ribosome assembly cofactor RimP [Robiginitalea sp. SC105]MBC2838753.1 ribosome assembly cofactor RimP [Robiginitalea sp. SC105]